MLNLQQICSKPGAKSAETLGFSARSSGPIGTGTGKCRAMGAALSFMTKSISRDCGYFCVAVIALGLHSGHGKTLDLKEFAQAFNEAFDARGFARAFRAAVDLADARRSFAAGFRDGIALLRQKATGEGGMEPISAIALSLALGAGAAAEKAVVNELVKDAYATLKGIIKSRYPAISVEQLEQAPQSKSRCAVVEEDLANSDAGKGGELVDAANRLIELVRTQAPGAAAAIGVDLKDVEAANLRLCDIAASGTGVRGAGIRVSGDIEISNVRAGVKRDDSATGG